MSDVTEYLSAKQKLEEQADQITTLIKERDEVIYASVAEASMLRDRIHSLEEGVRCVVSYLESGRASLAERAIATLKPLIKDGAK